MTERDWTAENLRHIADLRRKLEDIPRHSDDDVRDANPGFDLPRPRVKGH